MRPENILYGLEDRPPAAILLLSTLQQTAAAAATSFATLIAVLDAARVDPATAANALSVGMLGLACATVFNCMRLGPLGSGFLIPAVLAPSLLPAMLAAVDAGGLALAFGMTVLAGAVQAVLAPAVPRLRPLCPTEITGLVVFLIGLQMGIIGIGQIAGVKGSAATLAGLADEKVLLGLITLAVIIVFAVWSGKRVRTFSVLIGIAAGYPVAWALGLFDARAAAFVGEARLVWLPDVTGHDLAFTLELPILLLFLVGALTNSLHAIGVVTTAQKINDAHWTRPDLKTIEGGILATGLANVVAGLLGGVATNMAASAVGLSGVTGVTSRRVGFAVAVLFLLLSLCPVVAAVLTVMPRPVLGAVMIFSGSFVILSGLQMILSRVIDTRRTLVIGVPIMIAIAYDIRPDIFALLPSFLHSSIVMAVGTALLLNLLFRIGVKRVARLEVTPGADAAQEVYAFLQRQGGAWAARQDVLQRVIRAVSEFAEISPMLTAPGTPFSVTAAFDEFRITVTLSWQGQPLEIAHSLPTEDEMLEDETAPLRLASVLIARAADRIATRSGDTEEVVVLHFSH